MEIRPRNFSRLHASGGLEMVKEHMNHIQHTLYGAALLSIQAHVVGLSAQIQLPS